MDPPTPSAEVYGLALGSTDRKRDQPKYEEKDHLDLMNSNPLKLVNFPIESHSGGWENQISECR